MAQPEKQSLTFDFNKAVARARQDYPQAMENVTIVDLDAPDAQAQINAWLATITPRVRQEFEETPEALRKLSPDSFGFAVKDPLGPNKIVALHSTPQEHLDLLTYDKAKQQAYTFLHELGHLVVPVGIDDTNQSEHAADAFAFIEGIRQGILTKNDAVKVANTRITHFMTAKDLDHLTTASLDYVAVNPEKQDFVSLSPQDVADIARTYAEVFANTPQDEQNLSILYAPVGDRAPKIDEMLARLGALAIAAPADSPTFYIAARVVNMMSRTGLIDETKDVAGPDGTNVSGPAYWDAVKDAIYAKTQKTGADIRQLLETLVPVPARKNGPAITP